MRFLYNSGRQLTGRPPTTPRRSRSARSGMTALIPRCRSIARCARLDVTDLTELKRRLLAFQDHYHATASPFHWRYKVTDLDNSLQRLPPTSRRPPRPDPTPKN